jgi:hypothetical protein
MRAFLSFASLSSMLCALAWAFVTQPQPQDDFQALQKCKAIHPTRYCEITFTPSAFAHKQR